MTLIPGVMETTGKPQSGRPVAGTMLPQVTKTNLNPDLILLQAGPKTPDPDRPSARGYTGRDAVAPARNPGPSGGVRTRSATKG